MGVNKRKRGSKKLTVFHIFRVSVECLVDNARFEERPFGSVENQSVYKEEQSQGSIEGQRVILKISLQIFFLDFL